MKTFQDFQRATDKLEFIKAAILEYRSGDEYNIATIADQYDRQMNTTIIQYTKYLYNATGQQIVDQYSSNNKIASNFFHRLNKERCSYSLGNGVQFAENEKLKDKLGKDFDTRLYKAGYLALIHGISYGFWNKDRLHIFPATEFCPLWDEEDGSLRAGIRFWSLDWNKKPVTAVLYEEDGYTTYRGKYGDSGLNFSEIEPKRAYLQKVVFSAADGETVVGEENYSFLPIVPLLGNNNKQSTLVGMRDAIDSYDLIQSGFANDLQDCAQIYWTISGNFGMDANELHKFLDKLKLQHVANVDDENSHIAPYTQEIPTAARATYLEMIRKRIYEDFGALDVMNISAAAKTATEIESAYQPMDEEADDFEYQVIEFVQQILALQGIDDTPVFKRNKICNQSEQTDMILRAADHLDEETLLNKLPWITVDEAKDIMARKDAENAARFEQEQALMQAQAAMQTAQEAEEE